MQIATTDLNSKFISGRHSVLWVQVTDHLRLAANEQVSKDKPPKLNALSSATCA